MGWVCIAIFVSKISVVEVEVGLYCCLVGVLTTDKLHHTAGTGLSAWFPSCGQYTCSVLILHWTVHLSVLSNLILTATSCDFFLTKNTHYWNNAAYWSSLEIDNQLRKNKWFWCSRTNFVQNFCLCAYFITFAIQILLTLLYKPFIIEF